MGKVYLPNIPDPPKDASPEMLNFLKAMKEILEVLTGRAGGNRKLIDYMES